MAGFYLLHRGWRDNPVFGREFSRADAWVWMIERACWKPTRFDISGKTVTLKRGQFCCSVRELATVWGWSKSSVDRFLSRLKTETMIGTDSGTGRLVITICNYSKYQDEAAKTGTVSGTRSGTVAGQQRDIKEQGNKGTRVDTDVSTPPLPPIHACKSDWPEVPEWIPVKPWNAWIAMRDRTAKTRPTPDAIELAIAKLERFRAQGFSPGDVLDQSTLNGWTGLFKPKDNDNGNHAPRRGHAGADNRSNLARAIDEGIEYLG